MLSFGSVAEDYDLIYPRPLGEHFSFVFMIGSLFSFLLRTHTQTKYQFELWFLVIQQNPSFKEPLLKLSINRLLVQWDFFLWFEQHELCVWEREIYLDINGFS